MSNNILDNLFDPEDGDIELEGPLISTKIVLPKRCMSCKTALVCSVSPIFTSLSKIRVYIAIDQCPFFQPLNNAKQ
jgi:hypothetical protein